MSLYCPTTESSPLDFRTVVARKQHQTGDENLLLVEDDPAVRRLAEAILRKLGYRTPVAADGLEALEPFETSGHIDLVFTDVVMSGLNGFELREGLPDDLPQKVRPLLDRNSGS